MIRKLISRSIAIPIVVLPLLFAGGLTFSQSNPNEKAPPLKDLLKLPGKVVSEAKSARPNGDLKLTGYRVEEVQLPQSASVEIRGQQMVVNKAWRVTVQGGPFQVRALPASIWIDDQKVGIGIESVDLSQVTAITFDSSIIREGGKVSVSYVDEAGPPLPQGLKFKKGGENQ